MPLRRRAAVHFDMCGGPLFDVIPCLLRFSLLRFAAAVIRINIVRNETGPETARRAHGRVRSSRCAELLRNYKFYALYLYIPTSGLIVRRDDKAFMPL